MAPRAAVAIHCQLLLVVIMVDTAALGALVGSLVASLTVGVVDGLLVGASVGGNVGGRVSPGAKQHMPASGRMTASHSAAVVTNGA